ncbi:6-phosphogluconolactonase [Formicincola oecophyllae]|uniref:6-phosphogluconolactonase n=1 Tax=Formicincola oecophyllae TaxID=2558361 RepID=A0A4Y6U9T0_9PROT|nr:6-phosphogluconolactonase [Formicincola oecophyllae]QDH13790.1 6-phosphogluconolactonase [Formicincola oecophyllae]
MTMTTMKDAVWDVMPTPYEVSARMAEIFMRALANRAGDGGAVRVALSGGSTPREALAMLARPYVASQIDWGRLEVYFSDERCVPHDDPASNIAMARQALLDHVPLKPGQIHPVPFEGTTPEGAQKAAAAYDALLKAQHTQPGEPFFDLVMLGMGTDGHTASLFPNTAALAATSAWAAAGQAPVVPHQRVTLTYPALASSRLVAFMVTGAAKAPVTKALKSPAHSGATLPAGRVQTQGRLVILADEAAMGVPKGS